MPQLSTNLDDPEAQPYFLWDQAVTYRQLRLKLQVEDLDERALWIARVMRGAFWLWLIDGWRSDGLLRLSEPDDD
jgi:hypothetical protein